ncbi:putative outer membrane repeat protein [Tahibacter aquaticus]|uniref:Putative outer membrane repeat protein n=1 Tax=Tahibacter aquaticus TaxID=520092 RepID=A0A4R6ZAF7_9GAMM|nr:hypothetical protein [Tahibacter aquaticus]TDR48812.1 putative outer membrane repeat protein [Tahibacter aquaticus]
MKPCLRLFFAIVLATAAFDAFAQALIRVPSQATLQQAIGNVSDGGVIEIAAGTYPAPAGGFIIFSTQKRFTIRAAAGATVVLSGAGSNILHFSNSSTTTGRPVTFERLTFSGGNSNLGSVGGAVTLVTADATFVGCTFQNNAATGTDGGGGAILSQASSVFIVDSVFSGNNARRYGGALGISGGSRATIHNTRFVNNRVNLPNHFRDSLGGAIFLLDSELRFTNTRFENNQAGFSGGAIYSFGSWTTPANMLDTTIVGSNSTFVGNRLQRDPTSPAATPTTGGAIQAEDDVKIYLHNTRFSGNSATQGGGVATYRSIIEIYDSTFRDNVATGNTGGDGYGGAGLIVSDDQAAVDGSINRQNGMLFIRNSLFQGRSSGTQANARYGGCIAAVGDTVRQFGNPPVGTPAQNRAILDIADSAFVSCLVTENGGGGVGGAIMGQLIDLSVERSIFLFNEARRGADYTGGGGGIFIFSSSTANIQSTTFARSVAGFNGGAIAAIGSNLDVSNSNFIDNQMTAGAWGGSAIYSSPQDFGAPLPIVDATGLVQNSVFTGNQGGATLLEYDEADGPFNRIRYGGNRVFPDDANFFVNAIAPGVQTAAQLNGLVLHGASKAPAANQGLSTAPVVAGMVTAPRGVLSTSAAGDAPAPVFSNLAYAFSGGSGTLNGAPGATTAGFASPAGAGIHTLTVAGETFTSPVVNAPVPATALSLAPPDAATGATSILSWSAVSGTFLEHMINEGVGRSLAATGAISLGTVTGTRTYRGLVITREGGAVDAARLDVADTLIFKDDLESP